MSPRSIRVGSPQGIRTRGTTAFVWWGPGRDGIDRVETADGRMLLFGSPEESVAWAIGAGRVRDERADTDIIDVDAMRPWLGLATPTVDLSEALSVVNMAIDVAISLGRSWDPRVGSYRRVYGTFVTAAVPWAFAAADTAPRWSARDFGLAQAMVRRSMHELDRAVAEGRAAVRNPSR